MNSSFINTIKLLIYKEDPLIIDKIDFNNDLVFLEPLLFAYFNSKRDGFFSKEILYEILQGYFTKKAALQFKCSLSTENIAYIPCIGYFDEQGNKTEDVLIIDHFEILKHNHPLLTKYFIEYYKGNIINTKPIHKSVWKEHYSQIGEAIEVIKKYLPEFYIELVFANKKIYLHNNSKIINFTTIETLGMIYFYVIGKNNLIYFIEELIHQGSHNYLYYLIKDKNEYFKIDVEKILMKDLTKQDWDYRNIYGAFHGLYTVTKRIENFDIIISNNVFKGKQKHELLGRMSDMYSRFQTGLEQLNLDFVFTEKGKQFYNELTSKGLSIIKKYETLIEFDLKNRDLDFRYEKFCVYNSYADFIEKENKGHYNFN
jgi:hypothetical protein